MRALARDVKGFCALVMIAAAVGFAGNFARKAPVSLLYRSKASRLERAMLVIAQNSRPQSSHAAATATNVDVTIISLEEFQRDAQSREALLLDARPEIFYSLGHVPGALSLPRNDFEAAYVRLKPKLEEDPTRRLAVYCSDADCEDSELVAKSLLKLGYSQVLRFKGGWAEWQGAHLPEEKIL